MKLCKPLNKYFDHTLLKPFASSADMDKVIDECIRYDFRMIAINSVWVRYCKEKLKESDVHVGAAIGFPLGQTTIETKVFETQQAIADGCDEIDYVVNLSEVKNGNWNYVEREMRAIVDVCKGQGIISKVIFENCYLTEDEIKKILELNLVSERLEHVRDLFIFSCFCGLAYIDVAGLRKEHIRKSFDGNLWIMTKRVKTGTDVNVPLLDIPKMILNKYKNKLPNGEILPIISNQKLNSYLKEIADLSGIRKNLTFHLARPSVLSFSLKTRELQEEIL